MLLWINECLVIWKVLPLWLTSQNQVFQKPARSFNRAVDCNYIHCFCTVVIEQCLIIVNYSGIVSSSGSICSRAETREHFIVSVSMENWLWHVMGACGAGLVNIYTFWLTALANLMSVTEKIHSQVQLKKNLP